jgi:hypothetical protein
LFMPKITKSLIFFMFSEIIKYSIL